MTLKLAKSLAVNDTQETLINVLGR